MSCRYFFTGLGTGDAVVDWRSMESSPHHPTLGVISLDNKAHRDLTNLGAVVHGFDWRSCSTGPEDRELISSDQMRRDSQTG